jgi:hypothetical protein
MRSLLRSAFCLPVVLAVGCETEKSPDTTEGVSCDGDVCTVTGPLLTDTTFTADKKWVLKGGVFVGDDTDPTAAPTTLTIEPGTTVFGDTASLSFLLITRGSKIVADGTAEAPIVFTSAADEGSRAAGQWGGIVINGQAPVNGCAGDPCTLQGEAGTGTYGGSASDDNSGVVRYVRIEFPGKLIDGENELNGIALQGVGSGTTIDFVQVHKGADDCIEFFGGTANAKHIVCTGSGDDNLDWTFGWSGKLQFLVAQQHDGVGERGIEADNNEDNFAITPISNPTISNVTLIGQGEADGVKLRRGTQGEISNAIVANFNNCIDIDDADTFANGAAGTLSFDTSLLSCTSPFTVKVDDETTTEDESDPAGAEATFTSVLGDSEEVDLADVLPAAVTNITAPDFKVVAGSVAATGADVPTDAFFDDVDFRGAVGSDDWTTGWTAYPAN